jgi:hypothetical protein
MVLVTFAGTKVTRVRADARIKQRHREATHHQLHFEKTRATRAV